MRETNTSNTQRVNKQVYTMREAAVLLGCGYRQVVAAAKNGQVPSIRIGKRSVVPKAPLERLLQQSEAPAK
jgi:excisionase family DNA binding protein